MTMYDQVCIKPLQSFSKAKPKPMEILSFVLVILGKTPSQKTPQKGLSEWHESSSERACTQTCGRVFQPRVFQWTSGDLRTHTFRTKALETLEVSVVLVWRHWLWYHYDNHMYHDSINDSFKSRIILVLTCSRGTSRLSRLTLGWKLKCEAVIRSSGRGRQ